MRSSSNATKAGIGYTLGNFLVKGIGFLTLPIFSRLMTTDQFGVYNVFISYEALLYVVIGLAIHSSIQSANLEFQGEIDRYTSSVSCIYIINLALFSLVALLFGKQISSIIGFSKTTLFLLVLYSFSSALFTLYNQRISLEYAYKKYIRLSFFNSIGNVILSLVLMITFFKEDRDLARIIGTTTTLFLVAVYIIFSFFRKSKPEYSRKYWSFAIKYSLPIIPHGLSQVLLAQFDRIMIRTMVSDSAAGIYSLAANIKLILTVITDSITSAWRTWFYNELKVGHSDIIQEKASQLCCLYTLFAIGLMAISPEMVLILGGSAYETGKYVAIPMIIDALALFMYSIIVQGEYYTQKTVYIMIGTVSAAIINIITNYIFILKYGFIAAAYTTLFSYICYLVFHIIISRKLLGFYVIPLNHLISYFIIVLLNAAFDLVMIQHLVVRWAVCILVVTIIGLRLAKISGYWDRMRDRLRH